MLAKYAMSLRRESQYDPWVMRSNQDISDVLWRSKVTDCAGMFVTGIHIDQNEDEASKFHCV